MCKHKPLIMLEIIHITGEWSVVELIQTVVYSLYRVNVSPLTGWFHQCQSLEVACHQDVLQISVAAVQCDVPHVSHHDVLHTNIVLPEKGKEKEKEEDEKKQ